MRLFKYKCSSGYKYGCTFLDNTRCTQCGISYKELETIWDKIEDVYLKLIPFNLRPKNMWYKFKCYGWKRYTTVKPRTLGHDWCDRDALLVHCIFEIVRDFLDGETPKTQEELEWQKEHNPPFYESWREAREIYDWWLTHNDHYVYGLNDEQFDAEFPWEMVDGLNKEESRFRARYLADGEIEEMVLEKAKRIIDLSPYFWT